MRLSDLNPIKTNQEIEAIKADLETIKQMLVSLPDREKIILEAIEDGKQRDMSTAEIIEAQKAAIAKLEDLNCAKEKTLSGMTKWIILVILGVLSLTVRYTIEYTPGQGAIVKPDANSGPVLPLAYTVAIIAVATGQDSKVGTLIEKMGAKFG